MLQGLLSFFLSPYGLFLLGVIDATVVFVVPFGIDAVVILLAARDPDRFWLYGLLAGLGSIAGAAFTFWLGRTLGEKGIERFASDRSIRRVRDRLQGAGVLVMTLPAILPPPFPFKVLVLAAGALNVDRTKFFAGITVLRFARFVGEGALATIYGERIATWMESDAFEAVVGVLMAVVVVGSAVSVYKIIRVSRARRSRR